MPGDSVRVRLLVGVHAPTDGTPYPVVFKLVGDVIGLDGKSVGLGEARMIAAAQGSLTDSRVLFRLARLSMRLPNGRRKEFDIDGWVVGEDGIRGMGGRLLDPKNDPSVWKVHGVCGITEGMESIIKERLAHLVPVVQVLGNREAPLLWCSPTIVFDASNFDFVFPIKKYAKKKDAKKPSDVRHLF